MSDIVKSNQIHIAQVSYFLPIIEELSFNGVNTDQLVSNSDLKRFNLDSSENYVPSSLMYNLLTDVRRLGVTDFLSLFNESLQAHTLGNIGEAICFTPDVFEACKLTEELNELILSNEKARLKIEGNKTIFETWFTDKPQNGWVDSEIISLAYLINGLKIGGGRKWIPNEIHLRANVMPNLDVLFPSNNTIIVELNQPTTKVIFNTSLLTKPMLMDNENLSDTEIYSNIEDSIFQRVLFLINSAQDNCIPTIKELAAYSSMSVSSFQRALAKEGYSYKGILDNWRFKKAINLLENPGYRIKDISQLLDYSNTPNFVKAFKRWTNTTPEQYRNSN